MMISIIYKCTFVMFMMEVILVLCENGPCPSILQYKIDNDFTYYAMIVVPRPDSNIVKLRVQFSIGNSSPTNERFNGNITFLSTIKDFIRKRPLAYRLNFPICCNTLPRITSISVNGDELCPGAALQGGMLARTVTLTNLYTIMLVNNTNDELPIEKPTRGNFQIENVFKNITNKTCYENITSCGCSENETHPWWGAVYFRERANPKLLCGAILISKRLALTEGHCVAPYVHNNLYSTFGRTNLLDWFDSNAQGAKIDTISLHPEYRHDSEEGNIAILTFSKELMLTSSVRYVCVWSESNLDEVASKQGLLVDWNTSSEIAQHLQQNYAVITDKDRCGTSSNRTFCAEIENYFGLHNISTGSAFYVVIEGRLTIRGIVIRPLLTTNKTSGISQYVHLLDVSKYIDWILDHVKNARK